MPELPDGTEHPGSGGAHREFRTYGYNTKGQKNNPPIKKAGHQVDSNFSPWQLSGDHSDDEGSTTDDSDGNADGVDVDDPLSRTGSQLSKGRAPATSPLHPGRPSGSKSKGKKESEDTPDPKGKGPVKFSNPPGPKRGHPSSVLPGSSPQKREVDKREKERLAAEEEKRKDEKEKKWLERQHKKRLERQHKKDAKIAKERQLHLRVDPEL
ncbi:hypothetical protein FB451DRAFT_1184709 [Mycena latifolia]|nr:hypothetical protein FB451DRAFT_1184709 [Mycena latifolia]